MGFEVFKCASSEDCLIILCDCKFYMASQAAIILLVFKSFLTICLYLFLDSNLFFLMHIFAVLLRVLQLFQGLLIVFECEEGLITLVLEVLSVS